MIEQLRVQLRAASTRGSHESMIGTTKVFCSKAGIQLSVSIQYSRGALSICDTIGGPNPIH